MVVLNRESSLWTQPSHGAGRVKQQTTEGKYGTRRDRFGRRWPNRGEGPVSSTRTREISPNHAWEGKNGGFLVLTKGKKCGGAANQAKKSGKRKKQEKNDESHTIVGERVKGEKASGKSKDGPERRRLKM